MTDPRLSSLAARLAALEARVAALEAARIPQSPWPQYPMPDYTHGGCHVCGRKAGVDHYVCTHDGCPSRITYTSAAADGL